MSKLQNGRTPPASEELNRVLAKITGGDANELIKAAYIVKAPANVKDSIYAGDVLKKLNAQILSDGIGHGGNNPILLEELIKLAEGKDFETAFKKTKMYSDLFLVIGFIVGYLDRCANNHTGNDTQFDSIYNYLVKIDEEHGLGLEITLTPDKPKCALQIISILKEKVFPTINTFEFGGTVFNFADYLNTDGSPKFDILISEKSDDSDTNRKTEVNNQVEVLDDDLKKKMHFFESLELDLGLDLTDPDVQKKLKRAAKIIFSEED